MKFLEMAQLIAATQAAEKGDIEFSEEHSSCSNSALVEMFTNMVAEMFDYGRSILESRRKDLKMIFYLLLRTSKLKEKNCQMSI